MDTQKAQREFKTYLTEDMKLNDEYEKYADDGSFQYQIIIDETDIQKSPAKYSITGRIRMQPVTVRSILPKSFDIPFKLSSNNIRTDDWICQKKKAKSVEKQDKNSKNNLTK